MTEPRLSLSVSETLEAYQREALELRFGAELPKGETPPDGYLDALIDVRRRLDRVEELHSQALRIKGRLRRAADHAAAVAQDAFDGKAVAARRTGRDEYTSAAERSAEANLASIDERRMARTARALADYAEEAVSVLALAHKGLDSTRHDLHSAIRLLTFERSLDRQ